MSCICIAIIVVYLLFLPLFTPVDLDTAADNTVAEYDYYVDDRTPTFELPGKHSHFSSLDIAYLSVHFLHWALLLLLRYNPIQLHSLFLLPLDVPSFVLCCLINIYNIQQ